MATWSKDSWFIVEFFRLVLIATLLPSFTAGSGGYASILSFGDSIADTGNMYYYNHKHNCVLYPFGETYFGKPSRRCSNGRLVIDFIAEYLGLPLVKPYLAIRDGVQETNVQHGVNFAVAGATAMEARFFEERGIDILPTNFSLGVQLGWFMDLLPSLCNSSSSCRNVLAKSLFFVGEIGSNDYNYPFMLKENVEEIRTFVPKVIKEISAVITELINLGAVTLLVPGNLPMGCTAYFLTKYNNTDHEEYDEAGCLKWMNNFAAYHNELLQLELNRLQNLYPSSNIIYADFYNPVRELYHSPTRFGLGDSVLKACCGGGGPYNYNEEKLCGYGGEVCEDPSTYINWDGLHLTEVAYRWIAKKLLSHASLDTISCQMS